eukprot:11288606-Heterocapsa_arctica.AAC.1
MARDGSGPGGWCRTSTTTARVSAWSSTASSRGEAVHVLNEMYVKGGLVYLRDRALGMYLHVDDGIFLSDGSALGSGNP